MPLILGGMAGAFMGPFFAAALPSDVIARLVAAMIVFVGVIVLATLKWGGLGEVRPIDDVPTATHRRRRRRGRLQLGHLRRRLGTHRREAAHPAAHRAQGGHRLIAPGPGLHGCRGGRGLPHHGHGLRGRGADWSILVVLFFGSVITLIPGAFMVSRLGRETATVFITLLSISLALPTLIWGAH